MTNVIKCEGVIVNINKTKMWNKKIVLRKLGANIEKGCDECIR